MQLDILQKNFPCFFLSVALVFISACGNRADFSLLPAGQEFDINNAGVFHNEIDILFVIDNSSSMVNNQTKLAASFSTFINAFVLKGWNYKIAVTATDAFKVQFQNANPGWDDETFAKFRDGYQQNNHSGIFVISPLTTDPVAAFLTNVTLGAGGTGDERALSSFYSALQSSTNAGFLRPTSFLAVIILSDEDDFSDLFEGDTQDLSLDPRKLSNGDHDYDDPRLDPIDSYVTYLDNLTHSTVGNRRYNVSAITKPDLTCSDGSPNIYGKRYIELAAKTNGVISNICEPNFDVAVSDIQMRIAVLSTQVILDRTPVESTITVTINGELISKSQTNGWWYYADGNFIRFSGTAIPAANVKVKVDYIPTGPKT